MKKSSQWYSWLKRLSSYDQHKTEPLFIQNIGHLSTEQQAEKIADKFSSIANQYQPLQTSDISIPSFSPESIPQFSPSQVWHCLSKLRANKSTVSGDMPARLYKLFAAYLSDPLCDIINTGLMHSEYPDIYKHNIQAAI